MKSSLLISLCLVFLCSCQELPIEEYAVIPQPAEIAYASGFVKLKSQPVVAYPSELANEAQLLQSYLSSDFSVGAVLNEGGGKADITLQLDPTVLPDKKGRLCFGRNIREGHDKSQFTGRYPEWCSDFEAGDQRKRDGKLMVQKAIVTDYPAFFVACLYVRRRSLFQRQRSGEAAVG